MEELRKQSYADAKRMLNMKADLQRALEPLHEKTRRVEELEKELEAFHSTYACAAVVMVIHLTG